ncbi:MAG: 7TMR-DISMED2 domain-containing protein, partial [Flavipsychrobacter sp.]
MSKVFFTVIIPILLAFSFSSTAYADPVVSNGSRLLIGKRVEILNDSLNRYTIQDVVHANTFYESDVNTPNFDISNSTYWIRFSIKNITHQSLLLEVDDALIDTSNLYIIKNGEPTL